MTVTATPALLQAANNAVQNFVQGTDSAGTSKTVFTAGANGSKLTGLFATTDDGSATHLLSIYVKRSGTSYLLGSITLPVNAGNDGSVATLDILNSSLLQGLPVDNDGQRYYLMKNGDTIELAFATALTASKRINVHAIGADF